MKAVDSRGRPTWTGFVDKWSPRGLVYKVDELGSQYWPSVCGTPHPIPQLYEMDCWEGEPNVKLHSLTVRLELSQPVNLLNKFFIKKFFFF